MIQSKELSNSSPEMTDIGGDFIVNNGPSMASLLMAGTTQGSDVSKLIVALMVHQKSEASESHPKESSDDKKVNVNVNGGGESNDPYGLQALSKGVSGAASGLANIQGGGGDKKEPDAEKKTDGNAAKPPPETPPPAASEAPSEPPAAA